MSRRPTLVAFGVIAFAACVALLLVRAHYNVAPTNPNGSGAAVPTISAALPAKSAVNGPPNAKESHGTLDDRPFAEVRSELERLARAGDAAAARRLAMTLTNCNGYKPITDESLENIVVED